ncbi:MAG TPA: acyl-CoA dehydrogenase, partial [Umezawaea sp.]|nr:acyl-CoA dehydrogenase [Umezawaea sp.]
AVDAHLSVAGDIIDPDADRGRKAKAAAKAGGFYAKWLPTLVVGKGQVPGSFAEFGPLATHLRFVERSSRKLARHTFYAMSRWQGRMERKQRFLGRVVDIGAELFAISATCVRAKADGGNAAELADAFAKQARVRVDELFDRLWTNTDDSDVVLTKKVMAGEFSWLEDGVLDPSLPGAWIADSGHHESRAADVHRTTPNG